MADLIYQLLEAELKISLNCATSKLVKEVDIQSIYAIGLYVNGELNYISLTANAYYEEVNMSKKWSPPDLAIPFICTRMS